MVKQCIICKDTKLAHTSLHQFPKDEPRLQEWLHFCGIRDKPSISVQSKRLCSLHFSETSFINSTYHQRGLNNPETNTQLQWHCPNGECQNLFNLYETSKQEVVEKTCLYKNEKKAHKMTRQQSSRRKKALTLKTSQLKNAIIKNKLKVHRTGYQQKLLATIQENPILRESIENEFKKKHGRRYRAVCQIATLQKLTSSAGYRNLRDTGVLILPHPRTISRWHNEIRSEAGFNQGTWKSMKAAAKNMTAKERVVAILIDGMAIKPSITYHAQSDIMYGFPTALKEGFENNNIDILANEAVVFMVRSIYTKFKQILGYFYAKSTLGYEKQADRVREAVQLLLSAGFSPVLLVMDQHATNIKMMEQLGTTLEKPYFTVGSAEVVVLFDTPHIIKSIRNNLYSKNLLFNEKIVSFKHIKDLYNLDINIVPRLAPRLTKQAVELNNFSKMNVKLATRTMSTSTSKAIQAYINLEKLGEDAEPTANFIQIMDNFFDVFNSRFKEDKVKPLRRALSNDAEQWNFLAEVRTIFEKMIFVPSSSFNPSTAIHEANESMTNAQRKPPCLMGLIHNISALHHLWNVLSTNYKFTHLRTNKTCQDPLENQFSDVRRACGSNDTPNAEEFGIALKHSMVKRTITVSSQANCQPDHTTPLIGNQASADVPQELFEEENIEDPLAECGDYADRLFEPLEIEIIHQLDKAELNALTYVVGYSISKLKHTTCRKSMNRPNDVASVSDDELMFCRLKRVLVSSNFILPNTQAVKIGLLLKAACQQKFSRFLTQNRRSVKFRLKEYIDYKDFRSIICVICFNSLVNRILNVLIKAEIGKIQPTVQANRPRLNGKSRRMGIAQRYQQKKRKNPILSKKSKQKGNVQKRLLATEQVSLHSRSSLPCSTSICSSMQANTNHATKDFRSPCVPSSVESELSKTMDVIKALEDLAASFPCPEEIQIEEKNCFQLTNEEIVNTYNLYEQELTMLFNKHKSLPSKYLRTLEHLVNWETVSNIMSDDQIYFMCLYLEEKLVSLDSKGMYHDFLDDVLVFEWALRIFQKQHGFEERHLALEHIRLQEQAAIHRMASEV